MKWPFSCRANKKPPLAKPVRLRRWRPILEQLEDRLAPAVGPVGPEFQVNTTTSGWQSTFLSRSVAMDNDGDFVVVWASRNLYQDSVYGQRYNAAGDPQGSEFQVNSRTDGAETEASVAMDADGDFVVTWTTHSQEEGTPDIYARRFNAEGVPQGSDFRVNTYLLGYQWRPKVAMDADGDFVITWTSDEQDGSGDGVFAQRFNVLGEAQGSEFQVNTTFTDQQQESAVAMDPDGNFVIVWTSNHTGGLNIYARRYNAGGEVQGNEFLVSLDAFLTQLYPSAAMDAEGNFVIAWAGDTQESLTTNIVALRYDRDGVPQGDQFQVNTDKDDLVTGSASSVAMGKNGDFVVTWSGYSLEDSYDIYGQRFNAAGQRQGGQVRINSYTTDSQGSSSIAMDADGDFVVAWESDWQDGHQTGVFAQRYENDNRSPTTPGFPPVTVDEDADDTVLDLWNFFNDAEDGPPGLSYTVEWIDDPGGIFSDVTVTPDEFLVLEYAPNAFGSATVRVRATDSGGLSVESDLEVTVCPVADTPSVTDATTTRNRQTTSGLVISRNSVDGTEVTHFQITGITNGGLFHNDGVTPINDGDFITFAQGNDGLKFTPDPDFVGTGSFTVQAATSASEDGLGGDSGSATITVTLPNNAPVLDTTGNPKLTPLPRNTTNPSGDTVASIVGDSISDVNGDPIGIAVVGLTGTGNGSWQYRLSGETLWRNFGNVPAGRARLLRGTDSIRFWPNPGFVGTATITYYAWDRTSGTTGALEQLPQTLGGGTAFSTAAETAAIKVAMTLKTVVYGQKNKGDKVSEFRGPDFAGAPGIAVVGLTGNGNGKWQFSTDGGDSWKNFAAVSPNAALLLRAKDKVRFKPNPGFTGTAMITYHAWDRTVGKKGKPFNIVGSPAFSVTSDLSFAVVVAG